MNNEIAEIEGELLYDDLYNKLKESLQTCGQ